MENLAMALVLGSICGVIGGLMLIINTYANMFRHIFYKTNWQKMLDSCLLILLTATFWFWAPYFANENCLLTEDLRT